MCDVVVGLSCVNGHSGKGMTFVAAPLTYVSANNKVNSWSSAVVSIPSAARLLPNNRTFWRCSANATYAAPATDFELENKKHDLLRAVQETERGLKTTADQRSSIEEALVSVEKYDAGEPVNLDTLDGTWRLQYTSAPDVVVLFDAASKLPIFQVGQIFQKFECRDRSDGGVVRNVIKWSIQSLLEHDIIEVFWLKENEGATLLVSAKFSVVSRRNIYLEFEEITLQDIIISDQLQALITPAILPRTYVNLQILQFIRSFKAQIPVSSPATQSLVDLNVIIYGVHRTGLGPFHLPQSENLKVKVRIKH
ncbi:hypothetical protein KSS87_014992, partial [Heliosperma pusillum]